MQRFKRFKGVRLENAALQVRVERVQEVQEVQEVQKVQKVQDDNDDDNCMSSVRVPRGYKTRILRMERKECSSGSRLENAALQVKG